MVLHLVGFFASLRNHCPDLEEIGMLELSCCRRRRQFVGRLFGGLLFSQATARAWSVESNDPTQIRYTWSVPQSLGDSVASNLKGTATRKHETDAKGAPLLILIGIISLPYLAGAVLDFRNKLTKPGVIIDARSGKIKIEPSISIPNGYILLIDSAGSKLYSGSEIKEPTELVKAIKAAMAK